MAEKRVSVRLSATGGRQVKDALRGVGEAGQQGFRRLSREMAAANRRLARFARQATRIARVVGAAAAAAGAALIRSGLQTVDAQAKLAQSLATTTASVQVLARAADLSGNSFRELEAGSARLAFVAEVRSLAHVLGQTVGRIFQATCDAALADARCGVDLEDPANKGTGAVIDLLRDRAFTASGLGGFEDGWFTFGTIEWTSGANAGRKAEVLGHDVTDGIAVLTLLEAPVRAIAEGDAFTIRAGCDKRMETCGAKFANTANFRGFPHIPGQDAVLRYATKDGGHEGGVL